MECHSCEATVALELIEQWGSQARTFHRQDGPSMQAPLGSALLVL